MAESASKTEVSRIAGDTSLLHKVEYSRPPVTEEDGLIVTRTSAWTAPGCHNGCGVLVYTTKDGEFVKVEGDPDDPYNEGRLCARCMAFKDVLNHKDRLLYPMKRVGKRGENKWERISWDEAYDTIVREFTRIKKTYGADAIHGWRGTGRNIKWQVGRLLLALGSPNEYGALSGTSCYLPRLSAMAQMLGGMCIADFAQDFADRFDNPTYKLPECTIVWGCNPVLANPDQFMGHWVVDALKRGMKMIVVDPRVTWMSARADIHLAIRPGTDGALALAMLNVIINEDLYDHDYVDRWTYGFEQLAERVQEYPPDKMAKACWIEEEDLRAAARLFAKSKPANVVWGVAVDMSKSGVHTAQSIASLWVITGNHDVPGGQIYTSTPFGLIDLTRGSWGYDEYLSPEMQEKRVGIDKYPMYKWGLRHCQPDEALLAAEAGKMKAVWCQSTSFITGHSQEPDRWEALLADPEKVEFVVGVDIFMNPSIMYADIVLPIATWAERDSIRGGYNAIVSIKGPVKPLGEVKSDEQINLELGKRLNEEIWPWDNLKELYDELLSKSPFSWEELYQYGPLYQDYVYRKGENGQIRADGQLGFNTATGRLELYCTSFERMGYDPLPHWEEPTWSPVSTPDLYEEYPMILMTGTRSPVLFHSEHRQIEKLRQIHHDPQVEINARWAQEHGINEGDWVWLENPHGRCRQRAKLSWGIDERMALGQHGWWYPESEPALPNLYGVHEVNINNLLCNAPSEFGFGADIKCTLCKIYKVQEGEM